MRDQPEQTLGPQDADLELAVGDRVCLSQSPPFFKTAEPMPMLRPPDTVALADEGMITEQRPGKTWVVRFDRGSFLVDSDYLRKLG